jgi:hypothetical protein
MNDRPPPFFNLEQGYEEVVSDRYLRKIMGSFLLLKKLPG